MLCSKGCFFLLCISVDLVGNIDIFLLCKDLTVCFSLLLKFCKLYLKITLIQAVAHVFQCQAVNLLTILLKYYFLILKSCQDLLFCICCAQPGHIQAINRNLTPQRVRICDMDIGKKSHCQCSHGPDTHA